MAGHKLIDFDKYFAAYLDVWMRENRANYKTVDEMEEQMPEVYTRYLNIGQPYLDGHTPGTYFSQFDDAGDLVNWMCDYFIGGVSVPDQLMERIADLGEKSILPLEKLVLDRTQLTDARMAAIGLLQEIDRERPYDAYIECVRTGEDEGEILDYMTEALMEAGDSVVEKVLAAFPDSDAEAQKRFMDVLALHGGDERIFNYLLDAFEKAEDCALLAGYLGRYQDDRALPALKKKAIDPDINYLEYVEVVNAIEQLGGEVPEKREFSGDPYYESLKKLG